MPERAKDRSPPPPAERRQARGLAEEFAALEQALAATARGRWFLAEYARRSRSAETDMLLEAIGRLETTVLNQDRPAPGRVLAELVEMSEAIARTRREIAQIKPPHQFEKQLSTATEELDQIVEATEKATSDILEAAEDVQEVAWTLREKGIEIELCDRIDRRATDIYTACSFQDITGQRTAKVVRTLRFIEQRLNAMIEIWGVDKIAYKVDDIAARMDALMVSATRNEAELLNGPQRKGEGLKQDDVDRVLTGRDTHLRATDAEEAPALEAPAAPEPAAEDDEPRSEAFEPPEPLTLSRMPPVKCAALFG